MDEIDVDTETNLNFIFKLLVPTAFRRDLKPIKPLRAAIAKGVRFFAGIRKHLFKIISFIHRRSQGKLIFKKTLSKVFLAGAYLSHRRNIKLRLV